MRAKPKCPWSETWILGIGVAAAATSGPHPEGLEDAAAAVRQRGGALIEARLCGRIVRHRLDEGRTQRRSRSSATARLAPTMPPPTMATSYAAHRIGCSRGLHQALDGLGRLLERRRQHLRRRRR